MLECLGWSGWEGETVWRMTGSRELGLSALGGGGARHLHRGLCRSCDCGGVCAGAL